MDNRIIDGISCLADLRNLNDEELIKLASEVREIIVNTVSETGGHLASSLGVVELTIAMLKIFNPPTDKLVWDVGHQTYAYKILTGRKDNFSSLRQYGGVSGFLRRKESEYDSFGAGHAGTAMSAALGMAVARDRREGQESIVAILGDGAAGCGISYEAMNNITDTTKRFVVILNDNEMSISSNVGSMSRHLGELLANPRFNRWKRSVESFATRLKMGWLRSTYYRIEEAVKGIFLGSVIFEEMGLRYIGPIDGHDIPALLDALTIARDTDRPILLHVSTKKGKGYSFAENYPEKWHGTPGFDITSGEQKSSGKCLTYSEIFGQTLTDIAGENEKIVAITAAMKTGTGLTNFAEKYPDRFFDVGISEEHAVVFAAGLASEGFVPVFAVYSTFAQRSVDYIIHDVCLQNLPVIICLDRAGVVGGDGPTHHGIFDIALLRVVPGLVMMQPGDESEFIAMLHAAVEMNCPVVIRYPRGAAPEGTASVDPDTIEIGKAKIVAELQSGATDKNVWIWALGDMRDKADSVAELLKEKNIGVGIVNPRFVKPLDTHLLLEQAEKVDVIVVMENGVRKGGLGSEIEEYIMDVGIACKVVKIGWPDVFVPQGPNETLFKHCNLSDESIAESVLTALGVK